MTWQDSTINLEDILKVCKKLQPQIDAERKRREKFTQDVLKYMSQLRPCPLIQQMYGSMIGPFVEYMELPRLELPEIKIEFPKRQLRWLVPFGALGILKTGGDDGSGI